MMTAGYSGTPLVKKLGIKAGWRIAFLNAPADYAVTVGDLPPGVTLLDKPDSQPLEFIQCFVEQRAELEQQFPALKSALTPSGMLWISWRKKTAKMSGDLNEDLIRAVGLENGLVDVKVIAVDAVWSGVKFVYRLKDR
jgi:hypothetical protein